MKMHALIERYHQLDWSMIPLAGKKPTFASRNWKQYQNTRPSYEQLERWFGNTAPPNVAVITGQVSNLVVVDCDSIEDAAWWSENFPTTSAAVTSGGGGKHYYYQMPADQEVRNRSRVLGRAIDIRGAGGFIVAPPSIHPETDRLYEWFEAGWENRVAFNPDWIEALPLDQHSMSRKTTPTKSPIRNASAYIGRIRAVSGQGGHNATFRAACKLRDAGMSQAEALTMLTKWNLTNAKPPWSESELSHKVADAYQVTVDA